MLTQEVIAGKCNVVCTSEDPRNPQPSNEELEMADYIFHRTFDVGNYKISDKMDDKVGGIEVRFIFNKKEVQGSSNIPKHVAEQIKENGRVVVGDEASKSFSKQNSVPIENVNAVDTPTCSVAKGDAQLELPWANEEPLSGEKAAPGVVTEAKESAPSGVRQEKVLKRFKANYEKDGKGSDIPSQVEDKERPISAKGVGELDRPSKKAKLDTDTKLEEQQAYLSSLLATGKERSGNISQKLAVDSEDDGVKVSLKADSASEDKSKSKLVKESVVQDKGHSKKVKPDGKTTKISNGVLPKAASAHPPEKDIKTDARLLEVTRRPNADRSKWFKALPWEERMKTAHEQETLVLLQNLDPAYTSAEIEDIIWHGFRENCTAKVVQHTSASSPHSGQAFVIFKTREAAEMAIRKLDEGCLMLPNGRPLIGSRVNPVLQRKRSAFVGHLFIDKVRLQMPREDMKRAISTSHCSQPNTIEYEMAMEWRLLQTRVDIWWKELYKQQVVELRKVENNLKFK
uniref:RRM domain-containing protein n=1 Tax=Nelumbo nucifera TaxID=4432 RepID=A0A822ZSI7_NELNU|nr:TPA_asm: hypothetical protein HUJ06_004595 [Nelumbo nucifera]